MKKFIFFTLSFVLALAACDTPLDKPQKEEPIESIRLSNSQLILNMGQLQRIFAYTTPAGITVDYTWESSDTQVATIDKLGFITAISEGTAIITATAQGKSAQCEVIVKSLTESLKFTTALLYDYDDTMYGDSLYEIKAGSGETYYCQMVEAEMWFLSDGFYVNNNGHFDGEEKAGYIAMHAPMYRDSTGVSFCLGTWNIGDDYDIQQGVAATFDQDIYFASWDSLLNYAIEDDTAVIHRLYRMANEAFYGPVVQMLEYNENGGDGAGYYDYSLPSAYVNRAEFECDVHTTLDYMMEVTYSSVDATLFKGYEDTGLKMTDAANAKDSDIQVDEDDTFILFPFELDTKNIHYGHGKRAKTAQLVPLKTKALMRENPVAAKRLKSQLKALNKK